MIRKTLLFTASCLLASSLAASEITAHIANLNSADYEVRQAARLDLRQTLVSASPRALKTLEAELFPAIGPDRDFATRDWSIRMLELIGTSAAVAPLAELLDDKDPRIADLARRALAALPSSRADAVLEKAALGAAPSDRDGYADSLAYRGKPRARAELATLLEAGSNDAALALGKVASRSSRSALGKAHATAEGDQKAAIEFALIDAGINDRKLARFLAESGQSDAIQAAAFGQLLTLDSRAAAEVLAIELADPANLNRRIMLRKAMASSLRTDVADQLADLPEADQAVVLGAIADHGLRQFEPQVLALLNHVSDELQPKIVRTLGHVGSDTSYQPLLDLYLADDRDREVSAALARLQAPSADANLLATATGNGSAAERTAAINLLVLRNTDGVIELVNQLGQTGSEDSIREAAFEGMEIVGDSQSVGILVSVVLSTDAVKRQAQASLKKLSANLAVPDYLWNDFYAPAMASAANDDLRRDILVILDGNSGPAAAAYLQQLILTDHPLRPDALLSLQRWTDISGGDVWLALAASKPTAAELELAQRNIIRLLNSNRFSGSHEDTVKLAKAALQQFADPAFQASIVEALAKKRDWQIKVLIQNTFPELLDNPKITADISGLIDWAKR